MVGGQGSGHYNFSTVTVILTKPNGEYALTRVDVMPFKKNVTAVEYVVIKNATTLADSYRIIADALQQVKSGNPRAWDSPKGADSPGQAGGEGNTAVQ